MTGQNKARDYMHIYIYWRTTGTHARDPSAGHTIYITAHRIQILCPSVRQGGSAAVRAPRTRARLRP